MATDRPVTDSAWDLTIGSLGNGVRFRYGLPSVSTAVKITGHSPGQDEPESDESQERLWGKNRVDVKIL